MTHLAFQRILLSCALMLGGFCHRGLAQTGGAKDKTVADQSCDGINVEQAGYVVRSSRIHDPFVFLPWVRAREQRAGKAIANLVDGKPFLYSTATDAALILIENENFLPDTSDARVKIRVELVSIKNCSDHKLDLIYGVYSTQILPGLSGTPESRVEEKQTPERVAGLDNVNIPEVRSIKVMPLAGYDATSKLSGGGRVEITSKDSTFPVNSAIVQGQISSEMRSLTAALSGSSDLPGWLAHLEWRIDYSTYSLPTGTGKLKGGSLSAAISGVSRPLANGNLILRFGGSIQGGNRQSDLSNLRLSPDTVANSSFSAVKLFANLDSRLEHHIISASYGLELGGTGHALRVDWVKQIGDFRHEFWYPLGDHRILDLESRLTVGRIQTQGKIPLSQRFFGGNNELSFITSDAWQIRANPVIRAIPGSRFYRTATGDGGDSFLSYNLTAAYTLWRKPLVPSELSNDNEFASLLTGQLTSATSFEQLYFMTKDPHYQKLAEFVTSPAANPPAQTALQTLRSDVTRAQATHPGQFAAEFSNCLGAITVANARAVSASQAKGERQYGFLVTLLSVDDDQLGEVIDACVNKLNGSGALGGDPGIAGSGNALDSIRQKMESEYSLIDQTGAENKAKADMVFVRRTLNTLLRETNLYSISPVFVFDVARLGPRASGLGGVRYGPGLGLRFELANAAHFTAGYAWNTRPGPGEGRGTMFFSIGVRDLFR